MKNQIEYTSELAEQLLRYADTYEPDPARVELIRESVRGAGVTPSPLLNSDAWKKAHREREQEQGGCVEIAEGLAIEMEQLGERLDWADQFPLIYGASEAARMWDALTGGTPGLCGASEAAMVMAEAAEDRLGKQNRIGEAIARSYDEARADTPSILGQALEAYPEGLDEAGRKCFDRVRAGLGLTSEDAETAEALAGGRETAETEAALGAETAALGAETAETEAALACPKCGDEIFYFPACNEEGWRCVGCEHKPGEPPGFDPARDRNSILCKVHGLLHDLHRHDLIYCSNSDEGDGFIYAAAERCRDTGRFDQYSIIEFIFASQADHGDYWKRTSEGVLAGNDERERCPGGRLSTCSTGTGDGWTFSCFEKDCPACSDEASGLASPGGAS